MAGAEALIRHLRENPTDVDGPSLAERFALPESVVQIAIRQITKMPSSPKKEASERTRPLHSLRTIVEKLTEKPLRFLIMTVVAEALMLLSSIYANRVFAADDSASSGVLIATFLIGFFLLPLVQLLGLARHGQIRWAFTGTATHFVFVFIVGLVTRSSGPQLGFAFMIATIFGLLYGSLAVSAAFLTSYFAIARERKANATMTRQQIVERILEIRNQLESGPISDNSSVRSALWIEKMSKNGPWLSLALAFSLSAAASYGMLLLDPSRELLLNAQNRVSSTNTLAASFAMVALAALVLQYGTTVFCGFLAAKMRGSILNATFYSAGSLAASILPTAYVSLQESWERTPFGIIFGYAFNFALVLGGGLMRQVFEHSKHKALKKRLDPEALVAELIELESRVSGRTLKVAVLAADVVGSTAMKEGGDPLIVEWTFREYQRMVDEIVREHSGEIHATAGDGAFAAFEEPQNALDAALAINRTLPVFNANTNRMTTSFRIRIGLHLGEVVGELRDVQFSRVLDVAAHLEGYATEGSIAASESFVGAIDSSQFEATDETCDGYRVFRIAVAGPSFVSEPSAQ